MTERMRKIMKTIAASQLLLGAAATFAAEDIAKLDPNFRNSDELAGQQIEFYNALKSPFEITGFPWRESADAPLYRLPATMTVKDINQRVLTLAHHTSGGAVRFATDSQIVAVRATIAHGSDHGHMPRTGTAGFDLVIGAGTAKEMLMRPARPSRDALDGKMPLVMVSKIPGLKKMRQYTLFMPLYSGVASLEIGVTPGSKLAAPRRQKIKDPILFYGSSITQGGCASRPANNYTTMLCRELDAPQINLGFSGNAKGEPVMAKLIGSLRLAAFVMDYDHNAPKAEHLKKTHEKFFKIVREAQPDLPIIIVSGPRDRGVSDAVKRRDIVKATYDRAIAAGDKHVYFVDGLSFYDSVPRKYCTVDGVHQTDLGFYLMFQKILPVLKEALGK